MISSKMKSVRWVTLFLGISNLGVIVMAGFLMVSQFSDCGWGEVLPYAVVAVVALLRIMSMIGTGIAQEATATTILCQQLDTSASEAGIRQERRMRYKRWLWWTRCGMVITILQFIVATYLLFITIKYVSYNGNSRSCFAVQAADGGKQKQIIFSIFLILVWLLVVIQCVTGSDVLRWRSFYATHDNVWKAHYREVFDHGIREALCCLGRVKYWSVLEEDEVYSVARILGDLVAYRATGTGHLELLAGLALLHRHRGSTDSYEELMEAPEAQIREALTYHQFAEAAYTGPLLDFGRNPVLFPCAWLYRQGVFTPWTRRRRPILDGDNWWRGHAAAFLKYVNLPPEALRKGRVSQVKREAAYFLVVIHHLRSIVIAVRGTETPEDIITDGLCMECSLTMEDLDGLINSDHVASDVKQRILSSFPHYGHSGIVEAARELYLQIDGQPRARGKRFEVDDCPSETTGFLHSLLGAGCECHGYSVRIVGHSLGGAIGALLGLRLYRRYPNLHVYSYGTLPCVDLIIAEACSDFVTSIIYNDEFSARLSVNSIHRLRAAAISALANDSSANSDMISSLTRRIIRANRCNKRNDGSVSVPSLQSGVVISDANHICRRKHYNCMVIGSESQAVQFDEANDFINNTEFDIIRDNLDECSRRDIVDTCIRPVFERDTEADTPGDSVSQFMDSMSSTEMASGVSPEMFLPGLIIQIVSERRTKLLPFWRSWCLTEREKGYRAFVANRESFMDIIVTPEMFLDHLPWRCHYAMQRVLETRKAEGQLEVDFPNESYMV